jgi:hypothetical protein
MIPALAFQQFSVRSSFYNFAFFNHQDLVRLSDSAQPVGDHKGGATFHQPH